MDRCVADLARSAGLVLALLTLTGCYASTMPVIENGDSVDIARKYKCVESDTKRTYTFNFRENKQGNFFPAYSYASNGKIYKFLKIDSTLFIGQEGDERNKLLNLFFIRMTNRSVTVLGPDLATRGDIIDGAMQANHVNVAGRTGNGTILIEGTPGEKIKFLRSLAPALLVDVAVCEPA